VGVPTKEQFEELGSALEQIHCYEIAERIEKEVITDRAALKALFFEDREILGARIDVAHDLVAYRWLADQPGYVRAKNKVTKLKSIKGGGPVSNPDDDAVFEVHINSILRSFEEDQVAHPGRGYFPKTRRVLQRMFGPARNAEWQQAITQALIEYHYTNNHLQISNAYRGIPKFRNEAQQALTNLIIRYNEVFGSDEKDEFSRSRYIRHSLQYFLSTLEDRLPDGIEDRYPIKRSDSTAKERLFIYRMCMAHLTHYRLAYPDAISYLMEIEGFENILDLRRIEKLCAQFKEERKIPRRLHQ
jgi:hypothetical protein